MTKEMPCSKFVHPVSGVHFRVYTLQPFRAVQYISPQSYNKCEERDLSHLVDEISTV
jgi:hypothetical protein